MKMESLEAWPHKGRIQQRETQVTEKKKVQKRNDNDNK